MNSLLHPTALSGRLRSIRFRNVPRPLAGVAANIVWTITLMIAGLGTVLGFRQETHALFPTIIGVGLLVASALLAFATVQKANVLAGIHAELDRLG